MSKTVNAPVNRAVRASHEVSQVLENKWRRVPESNRCTRICNPSQHTETTGENRKRPLFVHDEQSNTYRTDVNENPGATAIATGAKDVFEAAKLPPIDSPEWAGAPAIILRHFCGVAV